MVRETAVVVAIMEAIEVVEVEIKLNHEQETLLNLLRTLMDPAICHRMAITRSLLEYSVTS